MKPVGHGPRKLLPESARARGLSLAGATACVIVLATAGFTAAAQASGLRWDSPVEIAIGDAFRGPWRMNDSEFRFVDDPSVAIDESGGIALVWVDQEKQDIYFQYFGAGGERRFEEPVNVSQSGGTFSWLPRLFVAGENSTEIGVLWQEIVFSGGSHGGEIFFARSSDGGESFTPPANLSRSPAGAGKGRLHPQYWHNGSLDLAHAPQGHVYAAWTEYEGALRFSQSSDGGRSFSDPVLIAGGRGELPARGPALAVSDHDVFLAWTVGEDPRADIHLARSTDGGASFGNPIRIGEGPGHADAPKLTIAGGHLHLAYAESPGGPMQRSEVRHTRARLGSGDERLEFSSPVTVAGGAGGEPAAFPHLGADADGGVYVLWERLPERGGRPRGLGYAFSSDEGQSFSAPATLPGSDAPGLGVNGSQQGLLMRKLAVSDTGRLAVVNSTYADGEASGIWLYRGERARE